MPFRLTLTNWEQVNGQMVQSAKGKDSRSDPQTPTPTPRHIKTQASTVEHRNTPVTSVSQCVWLKCLSAMKNKVLGSSLPFGAHQFKLKNIIHIYSIIKKGGERSWGRRDSLVVNMGAVQTWNPESEPRTYGFWFWFLKIWTGVIRRWRQDDPWGSLAD